MLRPGMLLLLALLVVPSLGACVPAANTTWFWASKHKTGTQLISGVLREIKQHGGLDFVNKGFISAKAVKSYKSLGYRIIYWHHFDFSDAVELADVIRDDGRGVLFFRDPLDLILSGYFYHRSSTETWLHESIVKSDSVNIAGLLRHLAESCHGTLEGDRTAATAACAALYHIQIDPDVSYHGLLSVLNSSQAIFVEANRAYGTLRTMNATYRAILATNTKVFAADLGRTETDFNSEFTRIFQFLGVDNVDECVRLARLQDIRNSSNVAGRLRRMAASHTTFNNADSDLKLQLRHTLLSSRWFYRNVEPMRAFMNYTDYTTTRHQDDVDHVQDDIAPDNTGARHRSPSRRQNRPHHKLYHN